MNSTLALLGDLGGGEILMIALLALIMFGSKRLPELGRAFGRGMREFKRATSGVEENLREVMRDDPLAPALRPAARQVARGGAATRTSTAAAVTTAAAAATTTSPTTPNAPTTASSSTSSPATPDHVAPHASEPSPPGSPPPEKDTGAEDEIAS